MSDLSDFKRLIHEPLVQLHEERLAEVGRLRRERDTAREALGNACGHIESMDPDSDFARQVAARYRREGCLPDA